MKKLALTTALALAALAVPAAAKDHPDHGNEANAQHAKSEHGESQEAKARRCEPHGVAYVAGGTLVSGSLTKNANGTYDGQLTVQLTQANHHARTDKATSKTYTLDDARVNLHGQDPAALKAGSRVKLQGRITRLNKKCEQTAFTATTTIKKASIKDPKAAEDKPAETETEAPETETPAS